MKAKILVILTIIWMVGFSGSAAESLSKSSCEDLLQGGALLLKNASAKMHLAYIRHIEGNAALHTYKNEDSNSAIQKYNQSLNLYEQALGIWSETSGLTNYRELSRALQKYNNSRGFLQQAVVKYSQFVGFITESIAAYRAENYTKAVQLWSQSVDALHEHNDFQNQWYDAAIETGSLVNDVCSKLKDRIPIATTAFDFSKDTFNFKNTGSLLTEARNLRSLDPWVSWADAAYEYFGANGLCLGMVVTAKYFFQYNPGTLRNRCNSVQNCDVIRMIDDLHLSSSFGVISVIFGDLISNLVPLIAMADLTLNMKLSGQPVVIVLLNSERNRGHAVLAYDIDRSPSTNEFIIKVYNPNNNNEPEEIKFNIKTGRFESYLGYTEFHILPVQ